MDEVNSSSRELHILGGPPGSGKSRLSREEAAQNPGLYVFAFPSIDLLEEQFVELRKLGLPVAKVHSRAASGNVQGQLDRRVEEFAKHGVTHGFYAMTHAGLMGSDLSALANVHWRIDEAIELCRSGKIEVTKPDLDFWRARFHLIDASGGWSRVVPSVGTTSFYDRAQGLLGEYSAFDSAAQKGIAFLNAEQWHVGKLDWFSLWSPTSIPCPASIQISGASFGRSVSAHLLRVLFGDEIDIVERLLPDRRTHQPSVRIRYFADWEATSEHWDTRPGRGHLKAIAAHIRSAAPKLGFWSGNKGAISCLDHYISDDAAVVPKLAGINHLDRAQSCATLYSAKATNEDDVLIRVMGLTREQIRAAREDEDIFQFAYRGAVRRPDFGGPYDVFLFSRQQGERLEQACRASGLDDVTVIQESLSSGAIDQPTAAPKGRKVKRPEETVEEKRARKAAEKRAQRREARKGEAIATASIPLGKDVGRACGASR